MLNKKQRFWLGGITLYTNPLEKKHIDRLSTTLAAGIDLVQKASAFLALSSRLDCAGNIRGTDIRHLRRIGLEQSKSITTPIAAHAQNTCRRTDHSAYGCFAECVKEAKANITLEYSGCNRDGESLSYTR